MKPILHLHIPKTGGQTLARRFAASLPLDASWFMQGDITDQNYSTILDEIAAKRVFASAHVTGEVLVNENRFDLLCAVRDPVSHIISSINHILREPEHILHALAKNVSFERLLESCPEWFFNTQARYLAVALIGKGGLAPGDGMNERWLSSVAYQACDRIKWLFTSDKLDNFCGVLALETGLPISTDDFRVNVSLQPSGELEGLKEWLLNRPHLYAVDSLLFNEAARRFSQSCKIIYAKLRSTTPFSAAAEERRVVYNGPGGIIRLNKGWYSGLYSGVFGVEYRAGPGLKSTIDVVRKPGWNSVAFKVAYFAGIGPDELSFIDLTTGSSLKSSYVFLDGFYSFIIDLSQCGKFTQVAIVAPAILPIAVFTRQWSDVEKVSFSSGSWSITN